MRVEEIMTRSVRFASPEMPLRTVAAIMATDDIGFLPVIENERLIGIITDRDMAVRGYSENMDGTFLVRDVMSKDPVQSCMADQNAEEVSRMMAERKLRRLPVLDRENRLVGVVSLADLALKGDAREAGVAMSRLVEPGAPHSQSADLDPIEESAHRFP